jgi:cytochrome c553
MEREGKKMVSFFKFIKTDELTEVNVKKYLLFLCAGIFAVSLAACGGGGGGGGAVPDAGNNSTAALSTPELAGANCTYGGIKVETGIDDNGNGVLDASEVDATEYVCNGAVAGVPADTYVSLVVTDNSHWHVGDNLLFVDFVAKDETAPTVDAALVNDYIIAQHTANIGHSGAQTLTIDGDTSDWHHATCPTVKAIPIFGWTNRAASGFGTGAAVDITARDIEFCIAYDDTYIYTIAEWDDPTKSIGRKTWTYDLGAGAWTKASGAGADEDRLFVVWPMTDNEGNYAAGGAGCLNYCHTSPTLNEDLSGGTTDEYWHMSTNRNRDLVDTWHWKAVRTGPALIAEDKWWTTAGETSTDALGNAIYTGFNASGVPQSGRKADDGISSYSKMNNALAPSGDPYWVKYSGPFTSYGTLWNTEAIPYQTWLDLGSTPSDGDLIPYEITRQPSGSISDVLAVSKWTAAATVDGVTTPAHWVVEMRRLRNTGDMGHDREFVGHKYTDVTAPTAATDVVLIGDATAGATKYAASCGGCHQTDAKGVGTAPNMTNPSIQGTALGMIYASPSNLSGLGTMKDQSALTAQEAADVAAHLATLSP